MSATTKIGANGLVVRNAHRRSGIQRRSGASPGRKPGRRGAAGDPRQWDAGYRDHAHARIGFRTGARLLAEGWVVAHREDVRWTVSYCGRRCRGRHRASTYNVLMWVSGAHAKPPRCRCHPHLHTCRAELRGGGVASGGEPSADLHRAAKLPSPTLPDAGPTRRAQVFARNRWPHAAALFGVDGAMLAA